MKRLHVHVSVKDLDASVRFYSQLFAADPLVHKADYAKWMLEDPRVNFAISQRDGKPGVQHLGIQVEDRGELEEVYVSGRRFSPPERAPSTERMRSCRTRKKPPRRPAVRQAGRRTRRNQVCGSVRSRPRFSAGFDRYPSAA
jgi:catechol 2,3-dioxygenase-like lactoylglutathione lyase family enzyme